MPYEDDDNYDRDYDRLVSQQDTCPTCGEFHGESSGNIRECADCGVQGCTYCEFGYNDDDLCDSCIDDYEMDEGVEDPDYEYGQ